jgi:hypothetical protein
MIGIPVGADQRPTSASWPKGAVKPAVTERFALTETVQAPVPVQSPLHPVNV